MDSRGFHKQAKIFRDPLKTRHLYSRFRLSVAEAGIPYTTQLIKAKMGPKLLTVWNQLRRFACSLNGGQQNDFLS
jgi:hypothetical protein